MELRAYRLGTKTVQERCRKTAREEDVENNIAAIDSVDESALCQKQIFCPQFYQWN